jgi:hypothetical protein
LEIEEREQEVGRRERWVIEEMRKLTDKVQYAFLFSSSL